MKYILGIIATASMIWFLFDTEENEFRVYIQVFAVFLFFLVMMRLMNKIESNKKDTDLEKGLTQKDTFKDDKDDERI